MYEIIVQPPAERFIKTLSKMEQRRLLDSIEDLAVHSRRGKELIGRLTGLRSLRIDAYRIIYKIEEEKLLVLVLQAGHRGSIYSKKMIK
jgi:mRNA interferase RelE/StbE